MKSWVWALMTFGAMSLLEACSKATSTTNSPTRNCKPAKLAGVVPSPSAYQLAGDAAEYEQRLGIAYLDITSNGVDGEQTRRCTAGIHSVDGKPDIVKVTTAQHCGWDSHSDEFANSKYNLQVWYKDGYFPVAVEFVGRSDWGLYARTIMPYLPLLPAEFRSRFFNSTSGAAMNDCLNLTTDVQKNNPEGKDVLCFSFEEKRDLLAKTSVSDKHRGKLEKVIAAVTKRQQAGLGNMPEPEKSIFEYLSTSPTAFERLPVYMTGLGFRLNTHFCSTLESDGPFQLDGTTEKRDICHMKSTLLSLLQQKMPENYKLVQSVAEKTFFNNTEMQNYYNAHIRCSFSSLDDIKAGEFKPPTTLCDKDILAWKVWLKWGQRGPQFLNGLQIKDRNLQGFNESSFYTLRTNSMENLESALNNDSSRSSSRLHKVNKDLGNIFNLNNAFAFLFDPKISDIWIMKKDSGSLLSIFGAFPIAVISTYNGEPTSGGASILPLPVPSEEEIPTGGGC